MKDIRQMLHSSAADTASLRDIFSNIGPDALDQKMYQDLSIFFQNKKELKSIISSKMFLWEYGFILKMKDNPWFIEGMKFFTSQFNCAKNADLKAFEKSLKYFFPKIGEAIRSSMVAFHLEQSSQKIPPNLFVTSAFREIGGLLEASLLPHIRQFYHLIAISEGNIFPAKETKSISFGNMVNELKGKNQLKQTYQPDPWNLPLNQWRNIAHHSNYLFNENKNEIKCTYGKHSKKDFIITPSGLNDFFVRLNQIGALHKITLGFFYVDNREFLKDSLESCLITDDDIAGLIIDLFHSYDFVVVDFQYEQKPWIIRLNDPHSRSKAQINTIMKIAGKFLMTNPDLQLRFSIFSNSIDAPHSGILKKSE